MSNGDCIRVFFVTSVESKMRLHSRWGMAVLRNRFDGALHAILNRATANRQCPETCHPTPPHAMPCAHDATGHRDTQRRHHYFWQAHVHKKSWPFKALRSTPRLQ